MNEGIVFEVELYQEKGYNRVTLTFTAKEEMEAFIKAVQNGIPSEDTVITATTKFTRRGLERPVEAF